MFKNIIIASLFSVLILGSNTVYAKPGCPDCFGSVKASEEIKSGDVEKPIVVSEGHPCPLCM